MVCTFLLVEMVGCITSVKDISYIPASSMTLRDSTGLTKISLYSEDDRIKTDPEAIYWWYDMKTIHQTQGDYAGRVLDGAYVRYDLKGDMIEKGFYTKGMKSGIWRTWHANGLIRTSAEFEDGQLNGSYTMYNESGIPMIKLLYQDGMIRDTLCIDSTCLKK